MQRREDRLSCRLEEWGVVSVGGAAADGGGLAPPARTAAAGLLGGCRTGWAPRNRTPSLLAGRRGAVHTDGLAAGPTNPPTCQHPPGKAGLLVIDFVVHL
jgi:hypothetical protein